MTKKFVQSSTSLLLMAFIQAGCANLYSIGPAAIVETPEVMNHDSGSVGFFVRAEQGQHFNLVSDASSRPLDPKDPAELDKQILLSGGANLALSKNIEAGGAVDLFGAFNRSLLGRGHLKIQLLGTPSEQATPTPHRFAIYGHPVLGTVSVSGDQDGQFGPGGYPWRAKSEFLGFNYGLSYGYRFSDSLLIFGGAAKEDYNIKASVTHKEGRNNSPAAFARLPRTSGHSISYALGLVNTSTSRYSGTIYYTENKWNNQTMNAWFLSLGIEIDKLKQAKTSPSPASNVEKAPESAP